MTRTIRQVRVEGNIAYVPLTKGYEAVIDVADVPLVQGFNWCATVTARTVYAMRFDYSSTKRKGILMHRAIMGEPDGLQVDHIDCNGLNNRRTNLRAATHNQNCHNRRVCSANTSGFKGVYWNKEKNKWRSRIMINGDHKSLGYYDTPEAAHAAYCAASEKYHKEFGRNY